MSFDWKAILILFQTQPELTAALAAIIVTWFLQIAKNAGWSIVIGPRRKRLWTQFVASAILTIAGQLLAWGGSGAFDVSDLFVRLLIVFFGSGVLYRVVVKPLADEGTATT